MPSQTSSTISQQVAVDRYEPLTRFEVLAAVGCVIIVVYGLCFWCAGFGQALRIAGIGILVAGAALLSGFLVGFIFGVPRVGSKPDTDASGAPKPAPKDNTQSNPVTANNNLVEISDWLTKIIVGVGLVELKSIIHELGTLSWYLGPGLRPAHGGSNPASAELIAGSQAAGLAIMIFFFALGFLFGYIWTRLYFQQDLSRTVAKLQEQVHSYDLIFLAEAAIREQQLGQAMVTIDKAIQNDPKDGRAVLTKARILKRQAMDAHQPERDQLLNQALTFADRAIALLPGKGEPIYNKACYLACLKGNQATAPENKGPILDNLKAAFALNPALRNTAKDDDDLATLRQDTDFKTLVGL